MASLAHLNRTLPPPIIQKQNPMVVGRHQGFFNGKQALTSEEIFRDFLHIDVNRFTPETKEKIKKMFRDAAVTSITVRELPSKIDNCLVDKDGMDLTSGFLDTAGESEILAGVAHEIGHIKLGLGVAKTLAKSRKDEYRADEYAVRTGHGIGLISNFQSILNKMSERERDLERRNEAESIHPTLENRIANMKKIMEQMKND